MWGAVNCSPDDDGKGRTASSIGKVRRKHATPSEKRIEYSGDKANYFLRRLGVVVPVFLRKIGYFPLQGENYDKRRTLGEGVAEDGQSADDDRVRKAAEDPPKDVHAVAQLEVAAPEPGAIAGTARFGDGSARSGPRAWRSWSGLSFAITPIIVAPDASDPEDPSAAVLSRSPRARFLGGELRTPRRGERHAGTVDPPLSDRCLTVVTGDCAVYCRHCNRKRMWRGDKPGPTRERLQAMAEYVAGLPPSGGDRLRGRSAPHREDLLDGFLGRSGRFPMWSLRIGSRCRHPADACHTRALLDAEAPPPLWFNTQFNHGREITPNRRGVRDAAYAGFRLQSVGPAEGVNDDYETMRDLLTGLERSRSGPTTVSVRSRPRHGPFPDDL